MGAHGDAPSQSHKEQGVMTPICWPWLWFDSPRDYNDVL